MNCMRKPKQMQFDQFDSESNMIYKGANPVTNYNNKNMVKKKKIMKEKKN